MRRNVLTFCVVFIFVFAIFQTSLILRSVIFYTQRNPEGEKDANYICNEALKGTKGDTQMSEGHESPFGRIWRWMSRQTLQEKMYTDLKNCSSRNVPYRYVQRGSFWVLENYIQATQKFPCDESITYTTHGEYWFLDNLVPLASRWKGPISVALYAPGSDFKAALKTIFYLRRCVSENVEKYVTFHIFFDSGHFPSEIPHPRDLDIGVPCDTSIQALHENGTYRSTSSLLYPINVARNIARLNVETYFVFASDIELYPSINIIPEFFKMLQKPDFSKTGNRRVYVLPVFEVRKYQRPPETKPELVSMLWMRKAFVFHAKICSSCHMIPKFKSWKRAIIYSGLSVYSIGKRDRTMYKSWEPFYIGTNEEPIFDERLTSEGRANKMTQAYAMCLLDYEYHILDNAFVVHKPGIKEPRKEILSNNLVTNQNKLISDVIKKEYDVLFGINRNCQVNG